MRRVAAFFLAGVLVGFACSPVYPTRCWSVRGVSGGIAVVCR